MVIRANSQYSCMKNNTRTKQKRGKKVGAQVLFTHCVSLSLTYTFLHHSYFIRQRICRGGCCIKKKKGTDKEEDAQETRPRCYMKSSPFRSSHCGTMVCSAAVLRVISSSFFCHLISSSQGPTVHLQCSCTCFYFNHTTEDWGRTPFNK